MKNKLLTLGGVLASAFFGLSVQASSTDDAVHGLAQGCYAVQSPETGQYLQKYHKGGLIDDGLGYHFSTTNPADATRFYVKPTSFYNFMLTDKAGRYLASHLPAEISAGRYAGGFAEWRISAQDAGNGEYTYRFHGNKIHKNLRHDFWGGGLYFINLLNPFNWHSEDSFKLVEQTGCKDFPEAELNVVDTPEQHKSNVDEPVRGFIDAHTHITSYEFMGGKMIAGEPFSRWGIETALRDSKDVHGPNGALDLIGNLEGYGDINYRYDTRGYPEFPFWPNNRQKSHMQYYYKWIERAHKGGLKMMVTHLVENEVLCNVQKTINPASWINPNSCNTMSSINLQIRRLNEMQDYIDAQQGGPGKGFFRLVSSSNEARQVIADGKLAVLMGIEASELFNCGLKDGTCTKQSIENHLQNIYASGVRVLYPTHRFDNQLGGARMEDGFINVGQWLSSGRFFETKQCDANTRGAKFTSGFPLIGQVPFIKDILNVIGLNPEYDESRLHCNKHGLSELGVYVVNRMIDMNMIIEFDHMSTETATAVMEIVEARNYSGVVSGHSHMNSKPDGGVHELSRRIAQAGGILAPYNSTSTSVQWGINRYLEVIEQTPYLAAVPFSTDMGGLGGQAGARGNAEDYPLNYPFTTEAGVVIDKQKTGNRVFDLNSEGLSHYGMLPDHVQDIREQTSDRIYESVMNSAEAYLQMWQRAEGNQSQSYINPLPAYVSIVNRRSGKCMDIPGNDDQLTNGTNVQMWDCQTGSQDQKWRYNKTSQMFENKASGGAKCLDNRGQANNGGGIVIWDCVDSDNLRWTYQGNKLASKHNGNIVADAYGTGNGANAGQWSYHGGSNQQWELRPEYADHQWVDFRDARTGKCLDVSGSNSANGSKIQLYSCNGSNAQKWYYNPVKGTLQSKVAANKCLDIPGGNTANHSHLQVWDCVANHPNQQFDRHGSTFVARKAMGQAIDASGEANGAAIILYRKHGQANQQWRASLN